jgi:hypothetical protein
MTPGPEPTVVEWGGDDDRRDPFTVVFTPAQLRRYAVYPLGALGAVAVFVSLLLDWQAVERNTNEQDFVEPVTKFGIIGIFGWGTGWIMGAMVLVGCTVLAVLGEAAARRHSRLIGLTTGGVLLGFLVAAAISLNHRSLASADFPLEHEYRLEPGVLLAFGSVLLLGAALWLAPRATADGTASDRAETEPSRWAHNRRPRHAADPAGSGPADLSVAPTEPFSRDDG